MEQSKLYTKNEGGNNRHTRGEEKHPRYRHERRTKKNQQEYDEEIRCTPIKKRFKPFYLEETSKCKNYTPLFKYLLSQVGKNWDDVWKDVFPRVDGVSDPIRLMVINVNKHGNVIEVENKQPYFSYNLRYYGYRTFSTLFVDENNILQYVDKNFRPHHDNLGMITKSFNAKAI